MTDQNIIDLMQTFAIVANSIAIIIVTRTLG